MEIIIKADTLTLKAYCRQRLPRLCSTSSGATCLTTNCLLNSTKARSLRNRPWSSRLNFPAITAFLWGLTPTVSELTKSDLLPTYAFFRLYQNGDKLRVHNDRDACEHSLSLTLGYSEGKVWSFEVGHDEAPPKARHAEDFGDEAFSAIKMLAGDAVLYRGIGRRHGRLSANPNKWSAHLFLHWVDRHGPYREHAFEGSRDKSELAE